ncbi:MAG: NADP-dependent malic enzyme [Anaerolineales bacterium]|nr:NADP-dependent malic enzyme [Anaerolineales bacterium]
MLKVTDEEALEYHRLKGKPGKISVVPTKPMDTQRDLSLAYSPGVAVPVLEIEKDPEMAYEYTSKGNLVAVISNGTAILGLGDRGALASKPVMEGKGVLFKKFADIDVFDIEVEGHDPDEIITVVKAIAPTFGGINLEDIKAPECFYIEETLKGMLDIPVFHDDQHGTAIISAAALANSLEIVGKRFDEIRMVISGAGASAISCAELAIRWGVRRENIMLADSRGVVYKGRTEGMNKYKERFAIETDARTLADAMRGCDVFYGLSIANVLSPEIVKTMAERPIILAMANPDPEIRPELAREARPDAIIATGRSDYANQVNNVLGFPFIFRGALDVRARAINEEIATPILIGRPEVILKKAAELGMNCCAEIIDPENFPMIDAYARAYHELRERKGITSAHAYKRIREPNVFGPMMVKMGDADAFVSGLTYEYPEVIRPALQIHHTRSDAKLVTGVYIMIVEDRVFLFTDATVNIDPTSEDLAEIAGRATEFARQLELEPRVAFLSFSNFGSTPHPYQAKVARAVELFKGRYPGIRADGEMQADTAVVSEITDERYPFSAVKDANVLVFPSLESANIAYKLLARLGNAKAIGPILLGMGAPVHVLQTGDEVNDIVQVAAVAAMDAIQRK